MEKFLVSAATGAMTSLLGKLGTMLSDEYKLLKDVRGDIESLEKELQAMQAFLLMMADVEEPNPQAKLRANAVRELSYDIEDKIDKFMVLVDGHEPSCKSDIFRELFNKSMKKIRNVKTRHKIAKDVKDIKIQVDDISKRYKRYKINESSMNRHEKVDPRLCAVYKDVSELVGIDGPRDELVKWLSKEEENKEGESAHQTKVISIVGSGGLGKTTLAKQVYNNFEAKFTCRAFVSVSRNPDMVKILSDILSEISNGQEHARATVQQIINQIRNFLKDRRYFIIIDDIWDKQIWQTLNYALVKNGYGSVIVTTTRMHDVATSCCSSHWDLVYKIKPLGDADSKELFFKRIFGCEERCPSDLKEASKDILKKCDGLPLAIIAISSLLELHRESKEEWERVRCSIGFAQGKNSDDVEAMKYILSLSYFDLPLHLRSCLLYLTMFPEDYKIPRQRLVHRWISEGLIHGKDGEDLVELGETYFHELVNRSLVLPTGIGYDGKAGYCQVHDTVLDFLIYKSIEENFCTLLSNDPKPDSRIIRRLSLIGNEDEGSVERLDLSHARSLGAFGYKPYLPSLVKLHALRVLDIQYCQGLGNHHVKDIVRLIQLRYLNISFTSIEELPREIGDLEYLETLDASGSKLLELPKYVTRLRRLLPKSVTRLRRLARLFVPGNTKFPDGIGNMKNLQELGKDINILVQSVNFVEELGELTNLRKLGIALITDYRSDRAEASYKLKKLMSSLCKLDACKLSALSIKFGLRKGDETLIADVSLPALNSIREIDARSEKLSLITKWMVSLVNLEILEAGDIKLQDLQMVGNIPALLIFKASRCPRVGPIIITGGFQRLQELEFIRLRTALMFQAGAMPNLNRLKLDILLKQVVEKVGDLNGGGGFIIGVHHLSTLACLHVELIIPRDWAEGPRHERDAVGAIESIARAHPNRPTLQISTFP